MTLLSAGWDWTTDLKSTVRWEFNKESVGSAHLAAEYSFDNIRKEKDGAPSRETTKPGFPIPQVRSAMVP